MMFLISLLLFSSSIVSASPFGSEWSGVVCGVHARGALCQVNPNSPNGALYCCSKWGWCGDSDLFCGPGNCQSGPCVTSTVAPNDPSSQNQTTTSTSTTTASSSSLLVVATSTAAVPETTAVCTTTPVVVTVQTTVTAKTRVTKVVVASPTSSSESAAGATSSVTTDVILSTRTSKGQLPLETMVLVNKSRGTVNQEGLQEAAASRSVAFFLHWVFLVVSIVQVVLN